MLPSTGYFKGINCPFYDSGLCERPYCHFRHVKKDIQSFCSEGIQDQTLQKLVSAAVQKVLQQTENSGMVSPTQVTATDIANLCNVPATSKVSYNPTPISELNKINSADTDKNEDGSEQQRKHIPIPYTPRKPSVAIKRNTETNGSNVFTFIPPAKYSPGSESVQVDPYTPKGTIESSEKYLPGKETVIPEYTLDETQKSHKRNYVPSDKTNNKKKILEYKPKKIAVKSEQPSVTYQPTPKSLVPCFSSDEDEVDVKKRKFSSDLNGLDDLGPEFDILDQILDEEKNNSDKSRVNSPIKENSKESKENNPNKDISKKDETKSEKIGKNSNEKLLQETKKSNSVIKESEKTSILKEKDRKEKHSKSSAEKSSYKKIIKDGDDKKVKSVKKSHRSSRRSHSSSKSSYESSKSSHENLKSLHENSKSSHESSKSSHESSKSSKSSSKSLYESSKKLRESSKCSHENFTSSHKSTKNHDLPEVKSKHKISKGTEKRHKSRSSKQRDNHKTQKIVEIVNSSDEDINRCEDFADNSINNLSESDEETITEECKRIFEEYIPSAKTQNIEQSNNKEDSSEEYYVPTKKRISRTTDTNIKILPKPPPKPDFKVNAAQAMSERLAKVREYHASKTSNQSNNMILKPDVVKNYFSASANGNSKVRIAHVPYASTLLSAKKIITPGNTSTNTNIPSTSNCTITQTVKKGSQRVAHVPNEKFIDRPGVLEPLASKIPTNIRSTYLNMMIDHCLKIYLSATDAYARAQHEELTTSKKCSTVPIYKNSAVLTISRLKKEVLECDGIKKSGSDCSTLKKMPQSTANRFGSAGSWSIESKNKKNCDDSQEFTGGKLYKNISKWILTEEQLKENGFPRPHESGQRGRAIIYGQNKQKPPKGFIRTCCRCKKDYTVDKKGFPAIKEECIYHPNNKYRVRGEVRYQCCSQDGTSDGCCIASSHVYEYVDFENLTGFVKTLPSDNIKEDYGVYSLDCEMCYTTHGLDLTRVTVINSDCKTVYETLIKPLHPIIDYNTRYSGITEEQMAEVRTTLLEVQATLLTMFNNKTILIGHSLESDFKALKLIHDTVIDTSVLFPHKMGPPYKRALRNLSSEYLKKIIQNSVDGHDSAEDATVCMELIRFKLKEDLKTR